MPEDTQRAVRLTDEQLLKFTKGIVHETLLTIGVDADDPIEMQRDFQHMRDLRVTSNIIKKRALHIVVGIIVVGVISACWMGFKDIILK